MKRRGEEDALIENPKQPFQVEGVWEAHPEDVTKFGRTEDEKRTLKAMAKATREELGEGQFCNGFVLNRFANFFSKRRKWGDAIFYFELALQNLERVFGEDHLACGKVRHDYGLVLKEAGSREASRMQQERALAIYNTVPLHSPATDVIQLEKARILQELGRFEEAKGFACHILNQEDTENCVTLSGYRLVADILIAEGAFKEALMFGEAALAIAQRTIEPLDTCFAVHKLLGGIYGTLGNKEKALYHLQEGLRSAIRNGIVPAGFTESLYLVARLLQDSGRHAEVIEQFLEMSHWDEKDRFFLSAMSAMSESLYQTGKLEEAIAFRRNSLELYASAHGSKDMDACSHWKDLGILLEENGQHQEAMEIFEKVLRIEYKVKGPTSETYAHTLFCMARTQIALRELGPAAHRLEEALKIQRASQCDPSIIIEIVYHKAILLELQSSSDLARVSYEEAFSLTKENYGPNDLRCGKILRAMALNYQIEGNRVEELRCLKEALRIALLKVSPTHCDCFPVLNAIGHVLRKEGEFEEALKYYQRALDTICDRKEHADQRNRTMELAASVCRSLGKNEMAKQLFLASIRHQESLDTPIHLNLVKIYQQLVEIFEEEGDFESALYYSQSTVNLFLSISPLPKEDDEE